MNRGFTLVETLVVLTLLLLAMMFTARITVFALQQGRQAGLRFRMMETGDDQKHFLCSLPFAAVQLAEGTHRQAGRELALSWRVETAAAGLKRVRLRIAAAHHSLTLDFLKSRFIQEVKK
ncbi:MAG TPA: prepilin-type N-terminal cleavage/methylation domain-containing protein [Candidatus Binatia bacterium]|nr:prepilin-type N-terminal cleavage/methylation domain-containing protein [Candidatus Binatia bacterium]